MSHLPGDGPEHKGHDAVTQEFTLANAAITYGLRYSSCWDASHGPGGAAGDAIYGMPLPSSANWYHSGFLRLKINGQDLGAGRMTDLWAAESGARGCVKMHFAHPLADVVLATLLQPDDDRLFVIITLNPKTDVTSLDLSLICYPSYFTYWNKRDGDRKVLTATQTVPQADGKQVPLDPASQWWAAFTDTIFDPAKGEGDGGCAVALVPEQVTAAQLMVGSYHSTLDVKLRPDTRQIRLCFWDFNRRPNQEALTKLQAALPETRERLRTLDPLPLSISRSEVAAQATAALAQLGTLPGREELAQRLAEQSGELTRLRQELTEGRATDPAAAERTYADKLAAFEQLLWDVRFFVLIHG